MTKPMKTISILCVFILTGILIHTYPYDWLIEYRLNQVGYQSLIDAVDSLSNTPNLSKEIKALNPKEIRKEKEGLYIKLDGFFVSEEGVFILNQSSVFIPPQGSDPSFIKIIDRLYWYEFTG